LNCGFYKYMKCSNVEIKAECRDHEKIRLILKSRGADFKGKDHQIDTYFKTNDGRLKLRQGNIENCLIYYKRENQRGPKQCDAVLHKTESGSPLKEILSRALGVLAVVDKEREIYFIGNVKFHLDIVKDLGTFVEIEAIDRDQTIGKEELLKQCRHYMDLFGIKPEELLSTSYSDFLLPK